MGKKVRRPTIQADNAYVRREEHLICKGDGCRNAIAVWAHTVYCQLCRNRGMK